MQTIKIKFQGSETSFNLSTDKEIIFGRQGAGDDFHEIAHPLISRKHLRISNENGVLYVVDFGSTNGSWLNSEKLIPQQRYILKAGDKIHFSSNHIATISIEAAMGTSSQAERVPPPVQTPDLKQPKISNPDASLIGDLEKALVDKSQIIIGRSSDCDIVISDMSVSRKHAKVSKEQGQYFVEDLNSTNGTFLNQKRISGKVPFQKGDQLFVGLHLFSLGAPSKNLNKEPAIQAIHVSKRFQNGNIGLQTMDLSIEGNQIVALMGPSGCGKSTLLMALNGYSPASSGQVFLFGMELNNNYELLKQKIGYVPQDDIVHMELSVFDTLYYAAKLRLSDQAAESEIEERISQVLTSLKINDPAIRNARVSSLSGGQRKRVSIAVELLNKPKILFLDEPTSPLDPETIGEFLKCLRSLCDEGTTVVLVTHKPEDLDYVDKLIFLGTNGYHVYEGEQKKFLPYFNKASIVEVYALLSQESSSKEWNSKWYQSRQQFQAGKSAEIKRDQQLNVLRQLYWLCIRYARIKISNSKNVGLLLFQPILIAFLLMLVFPNLISSQQIGDKNSELANISVLFFMAVSAVWFGVSNAAREIISERAIYRRERMFNMVVGNYFFSKWIVLGLMSAIQLLIFLLILKGFYGSQLDFFIPTFLFLLCISLSAILFGLLLSAWSESVESVMSILPVALMPQIILAGVVSPLQGKFTEILSYLTFGRWGTEGLCRIQDFNEKGLFQVQLDSNIYGNAELFNAFPSLSLNILVVTLLDIAMIIGLFYGLQRLGKSRN